VMTYDDSAGAVKKVLLGLLGGSAHFAEKTSGTSRNTTTSPTADPDLVLSSLAAGVYKVTVLLNVAIASAAGQGIRCGLTGTNASNTRGGQIANAPGFTQSLSAFSTITTTAAWNKGSSAASDMSLSIDAVVVLTGTGTIELHWAQSSSSGSNTTVDAGSTMVAVRIA
ncbi:MAG: hypothetical protein ACRDL7_07250, partial [Gaiellaceae bacterium]